MTTMPAAQETASYLRWLRPLAMLALLLALLVAGGATTSAITPLPPAVLNTNAATDWGHDMMPRVTTDGAGNWVAVWRSADSLGGTIGTDDDILVARSTNNGATWTAPAALNTNAATDSGIDSSPQVTTDAAGNWVAVWYSSENLGGSIGTDWDILVARSTDNGATWTAPAALNTNAATDSGHDRAPHVTTDGAGSWVAVWYSDENLGGSIGTDYDILVARSTDNGVTWTAPAALNTNAATDSGSDWFPHVTTDGAGSWVAVWYSDENLGGSIGTDYDILVARSTDNGATWTAPAALNTNAATDSGGDDRPRVTSDGLGNWVAVWWSNENLGGSIGTDLDILVARSTDNGATWTAPAALNTNAATDSGDDRYPQVTTDGADNWVAAWHSFENLGGTIGGDADILVARSTDNGATWTAPATLNTNAGTDSGADYAPEVTTDGAGNWVAAWYSEDTLGGTIGTDYDILYTTFVMGPPGEIDVARIDADIGTAGVQTCLGNIAPSSTVSVDIILDAIDPADGSLDSGGGAVPGVRFDDSKLEFVSVEGIGPLADVSTPGSGTVETVDATYSRLVGYAVIKFPGDVPEFSGTQPWVRVNFTTEASGVALVRPEDVSGADPDRDFCAAMAGPGLGLPIKIFDLNDDDADGFIINNLVGTQLAIGQECPTPTIVVDSTADTNSRDGVVTLREAILLATGDLLPGNLDPGEGDNVSEIPGAGSADLITFDPTIFLPIDPPTILIGASLTLSGDNDTVDASDTGVTVSGAPGFSCFYISGDGNTVKGIDLITGCAQGIVIGNGAGNTIGGTTAGKRNVISGNSSYGVHITGSGTDGNNVEGNYIGTNAAGTGALGNSTGVQIDTGAQSNTVGGTTSGERNVISGNSFAGVRISDSGTDGNFVKGNYIGLDAGGDAALQNDAFGVYIAVGAQGNTIGGATAGERNVISGNSDEGILIIGTDTDLNTVRGNYIGTNASGSAAIPNFTGVFISDGAQSNTIGGTTAGERNVISGNTSAGIVITRSGTTGNTVSANYIGTDAAGNAALANGTGVLIAGGAQSNAVGGSTAGERNVISGNTSAGVRILGAAETFPDCTDASDDDSDGAVNDGCPQVGATPEIGAECTNATNDDSGDDGVVNDGCPMVGTNTTGNTVSGNYIGTNAAGTLSIQNDTGVEISGGAQNNTVGGTAPGQGNTIAFNTYNGVCVEGALTTGNEIRGNSIYSNDSLGIDLAGDGVTANDAGDGDTGPNNLMNFPIITDVTYDGVQTIITGTLNDTPNPQNDTVDVYSSDVADGSGNGEGRVYVGSATPDVSGDWTVTVTGYPTHPVFTATATSPNPSTSEFSAAFTPSPGPPLAATAIARQGEATPLGGTFATFGRVGVPNITGDVVFWATVTGGSAAEAIFLKPSGGSITKLVAAGDATPVGGTFSALGQGPVMNVSGDVVFWGEVDGTTEGIFRWDGSLTKIAAVGDPTPVGGTYGSFWAPSGPAVPMVNNDGDIAFWGTVSGVSGVTEVISLYSAATASLSKVAAVGDDTPLADTFSTFVTFDGFATLAVVTNNGQVSFWGTVGGPVAGLDAIFLKPSGGSITKIVAEGEPTPLGGTYLAIASAPIPNDSGDVAFWATLSGSSATATCTAYVVECAVFQVSGDSTTKVIAAGDTGPPGVGGTVTDIGVVPLMNGTRQVTVWTSISNGFASEAMIRYTDGVLDNVAAVGNSTPIGGTYSDFVDGLGYPTVTVLNNLGQVAFRGDVSGGSGTEGIFLTDPPPPVVFEEVATAGSEAPDTSGGTFDNNFDLDINGPGQAVFRNTVSDGSSSEGIFLFFAGDPMEAVAVQGDDAPASVGGQFTTFGPPVSNDGGKIVSRAATDGGDQCIFLFFAGEPVSTAQKLGAVDDAAPEPPGYVGPSLFFAGFADPAINNAGQVVAKVTLKDGSDNPQGDGLYLFFAGEPGVPSTAEPVPICLENDENDCPSGFAPSLFFAGFADPAINENGDIVASVTLEDGAGGNETEALYLFFAGSPGTNQLVAKEDNAAPETSLFFAGFGQRPDINFDVSLTGNVAFQASLASAPAGPVVGEGLFLFFAGSSTTILLAEEGTSIPTAVGGSYGAFGDPAINTHNQVVARSGISGVAGITEGIFLFFAGSPSGPVEITQIALEGDPTPDGADTYGGVTPPTNVFPFIAYNDVAQIVYVAWTEGPPVSQGVFIASLDTDGDGVLDFLDNCGTTFNTDQKNTDKALAAAGEAVTADDLGNACDPDDDGDGKCDPGQSDASCDGSDNCPITPNPSQADQDTDGVGDACDSDKDGDELLNALDNCPSDYNPGQENTDAALGAGGATIGGIPIGDSDGDACDSDDDDDGSSDTIEGIVGTDLLDNCGSNCWPPDTDSNGVGNSFVGNLDFLIIVDPANWLKTVPPALARADIFDGNGFVGNLDFLPIVDPANWLKSCT